MRPAAAERVRDRVTAPTDSPRAPIAWGDTARRQAFEHWLEIIAARHGLDAATLEPASADASFRRYLRLAGRATTFIVMDAPPPLEDVRPFVHVAALVEAAGLHAPRVLECDAAHGFLLLTDLGREPYLEALQQATPAQADTLMRDAIAALVRWQVQVPADALPACDEAQLERELELFPEWCVGRACGRHWSAAERAQWDEVCRRLVADMLGQPQLAVHADWMPRNLMRSSGGPGGPGILDFQDAVRGPIAYDIASLLRDAYISWDEEREIDWAIRWWEQARRAGLPVEADFAEQWRAIEWCGLQRHLRVLGVFCRLEHRDGKPQYAQDLPRFLGYATRVALRYRPLAPLVPLLEPLLEPLGAAPLQTGYTF